MSRLALQFRLWFRSLLRRTRVEQELEEELQYHLERDVQQGLAAGLTPEDARYAALRAMGPITQSKEECRDMRRLAWIENVVKDIHYGIRGLRRNPVFSLIVILSLALGIGANTAVYSVMYAVLFRSLPVKGSEHLVQLTSYDSVGSVDSSFSFRHFKEMKGVLGNDGEALATKGQSLVRASLGGQEPESVIVEEVTANYFSGLQVGATIGRVLLPKDDEAGGSALAVISHAMWQRRFASGPWAIGTAVRVKDRAYTIVGVAAEGFRGVEAHRQTDLWIPLTVSLPPNWLSSTGSQVLQVIARLKPEANRAQLESAAGAAFRRFRSEHFSKEPSRYLRFRTAGAGLSSLGAQYRKPLLVLMISVGVILLLCCANVANLLLARQQARRHEIAVRLSLGASRSRIFLQLVAEALVLGSLGMACGLALAFAGGRLLVGLLPEGRMPVSLDLTPDLQVLAFTAAIGIASAFSAALMPALRASGTKEVEGLGHGARAVGRLRFGRSLVVGQVAGSLILLVVAGLMTQTLRNLSHADVGFDRHALVAFEPSFPDEISVEQRAAAFRELTQRVKAVPGMKGMTYTPESIYARGGWAGLAYIPGEFDPRAQQQVALLRVGPQFFDVLGIRLVQGQVFTEADHQQTVRRVVINQAAAHHFFGDRSPIGQRLEIRGDGTHVFEVIGVVRDVKHYGIRERVCGDRVAYLALNNERPMGTILARSEIGYSGLRHAVQTAASQVRPKAVIERFRTIEADVSGMVAKERMVGTLAIVLAGIAITLAVVGLYGLLAYSVGRRGREFGVRMALGATPSAVLSMILREALLLVGLALLIGIPGALGFSRLLSGLVYGVALTDSETFALASLAIALIACIASLIPARRAANVDPASALRIE
jgi:predicted permease